MKKCDCGNHDHHELTFNRREIVQVGGLGLVAIGLYPVFRSTRVLAAANVTPLDTADACIFISQKGAPSHMDTFSVKEGYWTPDDWDVQTRGDMTLPNGIMPKLLNVSDKFSVIHSVEAVVPIHNVGQYIVDTGQTFQASLVTERPSLASLIALEAQRQRATDDILPPAFALLRRPNVGNGFLNGLTQPFPLDAGNPAQATRLVPATGLGTLTHPRGQARFETSYEELQAIDAAQRGDDPPWGKTLKDYNDYYKASKEMMYNDTVSQCFLYDDTERSLYGNTTFGDACIVAKNLIAANKGAKFIYMAWGSWDDHQNVYQNLRNRMPALDNGLSQLLVDLDGIPSPRRPGKTLLDTTLIVMMGEFGRTPPSRYPSSPLGLNGGRGRDHYQLVQYGFLAGGGVIGGRNIGTTNADGSTITDAGWSGRGRPLPAGPHVRFIDISATIMSALGINWTTEIRETPSGRPYQYTEGGPNTQYKDVRELFE